MSLIRTAEQLDRYAQNVAGGSGVPMKQLFRRAYAIDLM